MELWNPTLARLDFFKLLAFCLARKDGAPGFW
jgi:hypothetical protein